MIDWDAPDRRWSGLGVANFCASEAMHFAVRIGVLTRPQPWRCDVVEDAARRSLMVRINGRPFLQLPCLTLEAYRHTDVETVRCWVRDLVCAEHLPYGY